MINLLTQGGLNIWLNNSASLMSYNLLFALIFGELLIFSIEMIGFPIFVYEKRRRIVVSYAFVANFISLIAGGYLITLLPV